MAKLVSVNIGTPTEVSYRGRTVSTGIYKRPVEGRLQVTPEGLAGDVQVDLRYHGGADKAVYAYPLAHYETWQRELERDDFEYGQFGENLTIDGFSEDELCIGDVLSVGSTRLQVSQPRQPCFKLGIRMGSPAFVKQFLDSLRVGWYMRVLQPGELSVGDQVQRIEQDPSRMSVRGICRLRFFENSNLDGIKRAAELETLSVGWRRHFRQLLSKRSRK